MRAPASTSSSMRTSEPRSSTEARGSIGSILERPVAWSQRFSSWCKQLKSNLPASRSVTITGLVTASRMQMPHRTFVSISCMTTVVRARALAPASVTLRKSALEQYSAGLVERRSRLPGAFAISSVCLVAFRKVVLTDSPSVASGPAAAGGKAAAPVGADDALELFGAVHEHARRSPSISLRSSLMASS